MVLMMAMSSGTAAPAGLFGHGCNGGCYGGGCYGSCSGGCYGGCSGSCHGGHGFCGGLFHHSSGCNGGGCYGSCSGCNGGCSGSCHGGHGFCGGLFHKSHGCNGGCYGSCHGGCYGSCYGSCNGGGCYGGGCYGGGGMMQPGMGGVPAGQPVPVMPRTGGTEKKEGAAPPPEEVSLNQAKLLVSLPADAKLFIDGNATVSTSSQRSFVSPTLEQGKDYHYTLRAEVVRNGQPVSVTRDVTVRAGEVVQASFQFPTVDAVAAK